MERIRLVDKPADHHAHRSPPYIPAQAALPLIAYTAPARLSRIPPQTHKFFIYTQASGLVMLLSILGLAFAHFDATGVLSFDYEVLRGTVLSPALEFVLMLGFFVAFAVKLPIVPLPGWRSRPARSHRR